MLSKAHAPRASPVPKRRFHLIINVTLASSKKHSSLTVEGDLIRPISDVDESEEAGDSDADEDTAPCEEEAHQAPSKPKRKGRAEEEAAAEPAA
jgi:hypothetical protein